MNADLTELTVRYVDDVDVDAPDVANALDVTDVDEPLSVRCLRIRFLA